MTKIKTSLIFLFSFLIAFQNNSNSFAVAKENKDKSKQKETSQIDNLIALSKNPDWKKLSNFWKKMNNLSVESDISQKISKFNEIQKENDALASAMDNLVKARLINEKQKDRLKKIFSERVRYLEFKSGVVKCYKMSQLGMTIVTKRDDLESRYDILEKLFKENKINSDTFKQTRAKIIEDFKFIDDNSDSHPEMFKQTELIDLLVNLNK